MKGNKIIASIILSVLMNYSLAQTQVLKSPPVYEQAQERIKQSEIIWDTYGVPHVFGRDLYEMYYGFGWAQMHNHAGLLLQLYAQARGRAAEYWGERFLADDQNIQLFNIPALARENYEKQHPLMKKYIKSFVKGINAYAAAHPEAIGPQFKQILPVTVEDVMAHGLRIFYLQFLAAVDIGITGELLNMGSNAYAIAPSRSASRNALLLTNPHLPWGDYYTFFEAHINAPGFEAYGATLVGMPVLAVAFNDHLGWTHTVNTIDASDRYELTLLDDGYLLDSVKVPFVQRTVKLKVKQSDGSLQEKTIVLKYSRQGPVMMKEQSQVVDSQDVIALKVRLAADDLNEKTRMVRYPRRDPELGGVNKKAYAIRIAGMTNANMFYEWHCMAAAEKRSQFETALKLMQLPLFNVIYADKAGNISYFFAGKVPKHNGGDWNFWHTTIDGSQSKYIWHHYHSYYEVPQLLNPATGFIQNANDPPWYCTYPGGLDPAKYPAYLSPVGMEFRPQRAVNMIKNDTAVTFDKLISYKNNTQLETANRFLDDLLAAVTQFPDSMAMKAAEVLKKWDRSTEANSSGAILFTKWFNYLSPGMVEKQWDPAHPVETPSGLKDKEMAVKLLAAAATEMQQTYGRLDVPWGEVYRFRANGLDYPANGGDGFYGIYRTINFALDADAKYRAVGGDSYIAITEFGKNVKARVLLGYGNASQPGSKHVGDQLLLLSKKEMRTPWRQKSDILLHQEEREKLVIIK